MQEEAELRIEKILNTYKTQLDGVEELFGGRSTKGEKMKRRLQKEINIYNYVLQILKTKGE